MLFLEGFAHVSCFQNRKYVKVAPCFLSLLKDTEQRFPETSGAGVNKGGFRRLFGDEAIYQDVQFLTSEEEAAFAVPSKSLFIVIETKILKKHLAYINNFSEIVNLYEFDFESKPDNRQTNTPAEKKSDRIVGSATQNIQVFNVTIQSNNHNFTQVR